MSDDATNQQVDRGNSIPPPFPQDSSAGQQGMNTMNSFLHTGGNNNTPPPNVLSLLLNQLTRIQPNASAPLQGNQATPATRLPPMPSLDPAQLASMILGGNSGGLNPGALAPILSQLGPGPNLLGQLGPSSSFSGGPNGQSHQTLGVQAGGQPQQQMDAETTRPPMEKATTKNSVQPTSNMAASTMDPPQPRTNTQILTSTHVLAAIGGDGPASNDFTLVPCRARGMPMVHNFEVRFLKYTTTRMLSSSSSPAHDVC
jgi:hypothetical protein